MLVPLVVREQSIGLLQIELQTPMRTFTHREIRMAQALGAQAATAIENARLSTETAAQVEQSLIINDISLAISSTMDIDDMISVVREQVASLTDAEEMYAGAVRRKHGLDHFPAGGTEQRDLRHAAAQAGQRRILVCDPQPPPAVARRRQPDRRRSPQQPGHRQPSVDTTRFLGVPLVAGDEVAGVLAVRDTIAARPFGLNDQRILTTIAAQLGATLQNARLFERVRNFAAELNTRVEERTAELQEERDRSMRCTRSRRNWHGRSTWTACYLRSLEMAVNARQRRRWRYYADRPD